MPRRSVIRITCFTLATVLLLCTGPQRAYASELRLLSRCVQPAIVKPQPVATLRPAIADPPGLDLSIDDGLAAGSVAKPGDTITYTLVFTNTGDSQISNVLLLVPVLQYTQLVTETAGLWTCTASVRGVAVPPCWTGIQTMAPKSHLAANFTVRVDNPLPDDVVTILLEASVHGDETVCGECGTASAITPVDPDLGQHSRTYRLFVPHCERT